MAFGDLVNGLANQRQRLQELRNQLSSFQSPEALKSESVAMAPDRKIEENPIYAMARQRAQQNAQNNIQGNIGALNRRFAAMGNLNSGAAIKASQQIRDQGQQALSGDLQNIEAQSAGDVLQRKEAEQGRNFQAQQAAVGRNFQRELQNKNQEFQNQVFQFDSNSKLAALDNELTRTGLEADAQEFNKRMQRYQAGHSGGLFGGGGFLGTGIGAGSADF